MKVSIQDVDALRAVKPAALAGYARAEGWHTQERYRVNSDVYVGKGLPEVIIPRTERLLDYVNVVADLIRIFAQVAEQDELTVYRSLMIADRDVVSLRVAESDDGSVTLNDGADLVGGARDILLAAACSLHAARPVYHAGPNRDAAKLLNRLRLQQTEHGSCVVTLLTPVVPPLLPSLPPDDDDPNTPIERQLTRRLVEALRTAREVAGCAAAGEDCAYRESVARGLSANLCEALVRSIEPFATLDIDVKWARTRPVPEPETVVRFGRADAPLLKEAARMLRRRAPRPDTRLHGLVRPMEREPADIDGVIRLAAVVDGQPQSVAAVLESEDYDRAVQAHRDKALVVLTGDLDRRGQRWRLLNPRLENVVCESDPN